MTVVVPTLSDRGWVTSPNEKIDMLLAHFFESDAIQSYIYGNQIANFQSLLALYSNDRDGLQLALGDKLTGYITRHFDSASVNVNIADDDIKGNALKIIIYCSFVQDGLSYSAGRLISTMNSKFMSITDINNG